MASTKRAELPVRKLGYNESPDLVYFSSVSENIKRFVGKLDRPIVRTPLRPCLEGRLRINHPYALIVPSYGGGDKIQAIPKQVATPLSDSHNRALLCGIATSGNTNFGEYYYITRPVIAAEYYILELCRPELLGSDRDVERVSIGLQHFWAETEADDTSNAPPVSLHK